MILWQFSICFPHVKFMKLSAGNLQPIWITLMKRKIGVIDLLFALLTYVCRMHSILMYEYDFYCSLKHGGLIFNSYYYDLFSKYILMYSEIVKYSFF